MQDIEDRAVAGSNTYISKIRIEYCFRYPERSWDYCALF
jgi:hypothetical protein